ncbi:hypothetical protein Glove_340g52 [Diversispora epigaea]|uniref:RNase H type-1 domain-containing protein n=1 Tax=Diversispora epigaea TaxID=1348612 RepID=A0A397HL88_9GLOM|nr:hypothetical protein Glove_340g52 [Diversispora epigaea]
MLLNASANSQKKVKAHSGVIYNEEANKLAKEGCHEPIYCPDLQSLASVNTIGC